MVNHSITITLSDGQESMIQDMATAQEITVEQLILNIANQSVVPQIQQYIVDAVNEKIQTLTPSEALLKLLQ